MRSLHDGEAPVKMNSDLRGVCKISKADAGTYKALCYSIDQGGDPAPVAKITLEGATVRMWAPFVGVTYEGTLAADGTTITGNMTTPWGVKMPLILTRATAESEWIIPPAPPRLPPLDPNAAPSFEVTTLKPSKAGQSGRGFGFQGNRLRVTNITLNGLITFAYDVHPKQIIGTPPWAGTDAFDLEVKPEGEGMPGLKQWKGMLQKLMADRFKLAFHRELKELPVYALSVGNTGPKLTKGDPNGIPTLSFGVLGSLHATNAIMADFTQMMQAIVIDRPVVDQTGLEGRFDFDLNWKRDDSQFAGMEATVPPLPDAPPLYIATQEQLGLKLDVVDAPAELLVVDHVEKPSEKRPSNASVPTATSTRKCVWP